MNKKEYDVTDFVTHSYSSRPETPKDKHVIVVNGSLLGVNVYSKNKSVKKEESFPMERIKIIKTKQGRITLQKNSFGINEIKVRHDGETTKVRLHYQDYSDIEKLVDLLLKSDVIED
ncbi:hypothetical protein ACDN41_11670 [Priestia aryabhattai]|uniref:hypothetical protein n=1 Tax=Priestia aryabhattai TaxID=412384 RepID=UPI003531928E